MKADNIWLMILVIASCVCVCVRAGFRLLGSGFHTIALEFDI